MLPSVPEQSHESEPVVSSPTSLEIAIQSEASPPLYPVSVWEGIAITVGALLLGFAGFVGLMDKAVRNATNPKRAEAIAQSLMEYSIPGGSQGVFGIHIGSLKMAVVTSTETATPASTDFAPLPTIELLAARTPLRQSNPDDGQTSALVDTFNLVSVGSFSVAYNLAGNFQITSVQQPARSFCGTTVPVTIQQGSLMPDNPELAPLPAVRYEASTVLSGRQHQVVLTAIGSEAAANAERVFASLECR